MKNSLGAEQREAREVVLRVPPACSILGEYSWTVLIRCSAHTQDRAVDTRFLRTNDAAFTSPWMV